MCVEKKGRRSKEGKIDIILVSSSCYQPGGDHDADADEEILGAP